MDCWVNIVSRSGGITKFHLHRKQVIHPEKKKPPFDGTSIDNWKPVEGKCTVQFKRPTEMVSSSADPEPVPTLLRLEEFLADARLSAPEKSGKDTQRGEPPSPKRRNTMLDFSQFKSSGVFNPMKTSSSKNVIVSPKLRDGSMSSRKLKSRDRDRTDRSASSSPFHEHVLTREKSASSPRLEVHVIDTEQTSGEKDKT